ncbi:MAG: UbiD family decarboxylase [bacterium]
MSNQDARISIPYEDLREWAAEADKIGELRVIKGASWEKEIGMATLLAQKSETAPAIMFEDVPGVPKGFRVLTNVFGGKRKNMTLGFADHLNKLQLSEEVFERYLQNQLLVPPEVVPSGPIFENVMMDDEVDLLKFPSPIWHEYDGGRYIGTGSFNVTRDPDENWINVGTYRVMLHDKNSVGFYISPGKHGRIHRDKYLDRNKPMPVVVVLGGDPLTFYMACSEAPYGVCEYDLAGGLREKPLRVVEGKITGLPIPANAEIAIEGFVSPTLKKAEGPFGEWTGYYGSDVRDEPVMEVKAVYHRNDPILFGTPPQCPPDEQTRYRAIMRSAMFKQEIAKAGVPDVTAVWAHEVGGSRMLVAVAIKQRYAGHSKQAGHIAAQCHIGAYAGKYVVVVDDDIDVSNLEELMWALCTRSDPATSIDFITNAWSTPLDPTITPENRAAGKFTNSRAIIDACRPYSWRDQYPIANLSSKEYMAEAMKKFGYLLE